MKTAILYGSIYGASRQYAQWVAEETQAALLDSKSVTPQQLEEYSAIVLVGGLYAGSVTGLAVLRDNLDRLAGKRLALVTVGMSNPDSPGTVPQILEELGRALTPQQLAQLRLFHLRGAINYDQMSLVHRLMMWVMRSFLAKKSKGPVSEDDRGTLTRENRDFRDRSTIAPIVDWIQAVSAPR